MLGLPQAVRNLGEEVPVARYFPRSRFWQHRDLERLAGGLNYRRLAKGLRDR